MKFIFRISCILVFLLAFSTLHSQREIQWGPEVFKPASGTSLSVIGNWPDGILMQLRTQAKLFSGGKTYLQRFDNMTLLPQFNKEVTLETSKGNKELQYEVLERVGDNPVLFATYFNKEKDKLELFGRAYTTEGEALNKEKKLAEFPAARKSQMEALNFVQSTDSSTMLAFFSERFDTYSEEKIDFVLFNQSLDVVFNRSVEFPYKGKNLTIHRAEVDPSGRVFLLIKIQREEKELHQQNVPEYRYSLVTFASDTGIVEDYEIDLGEQYISDIDMIIENSKQIVLSGFYSDGGQGMAAGTFCFKVDRLLNKINEKKLVPFDKSFAASFLESSRIKGKIELSQFKLDHFVRFNDGTFGLIAEQYLMDQICYQDFRTGMYNCNYFFYYNNIIIVKMDALGDVIWTADIPKYQESSNDGGFFSSYAFAFDGQSMHFVFNDHPKNLVEQNQSRAHVMSNVRKSVPVYARIDNDGQFSRRQISFEKHPRLFFAPRYSAQISNRSLWLISMTTNKFRAGVLSLD